MAADVALTAATVLRTSLDEHVAQVQAADGALQDPGIEWDSHPMYVGFRRLSTTLSVCQPLLDEAVVALNDEVRWFLGELRPLRQVDLVRQRVAADDSHGDTPDRLSAALDEALAQLRVDALHRAAQAWTSERHRHLSTALGRLYGTSAIRPESRQPAIEVYRTLTVTELRTLRTRAEPTFSAGGADLERRFNDLRGSTRRVRCASSLLGQVDAPTAARVRRRLKKLIRLLHERRDSTVTRACLESLLDGNLDPALAEPVERLIKQETAATARVAKKLPAAATRALSAQRVLESS